MSLFDNGRGSAVFVKETTSTTAYLKKLREASLQCPESMQPRIERDIRICEAGLNGENQVAFELMNSHLSSCVLRDLRLQHDGLTAQLDFLVLMPYVNVIIECKNLVGDITVDKHGDFIREFGSKGKRYREGIYSPITQNARHLELIRAIRLDEMGAIRKLLSQAFFDDRYKSIVVLANPKTILHGSSAPKDVREKIVRGDRLVDYLQHANREGKNKGNGKCRDRELHAQAEYWLSKHIEAERELPADYLKMLPGDAIPNCPKCGAPMIRRRVTKGKRQGREIWGCPHFPRCRGVINID